MQATSDGLLCSPSEHLLRPVIPIADLSIEAAKDNCVVSLVEQAVLLGTPIEFGLEAIARTAEILLVPALKRSEICHGAAPYDEQQKTWQLRRRNVKAVTRLGKEEVIAQQR